MVAAAYLGGSRRSGDTGQPYPLLFLRDHRGDHRRNGLLDTLGAIGSVHGVLPAHQSRGVAAVGRTHGLALRLVFFVGTIVIGLAAAGGLTAVIERSDWLRDQARVRTSASPFAEACESRVSSGPGTASARELELGTARLRRFGREVAVTGRRLLVFFLVFTAVGYLVIRAIPTAWVTDLLGRGSSGAIPLAALVGIPSYVNTEASLPLVAALVDGGWAPGPPWHSS